MDNTLIQFVFWPYDRFPFTLGAPAAARPNGMYYVPSYQMTVKPVAVYSIEEGRDIAAAITHHQNQYNTAMHALQVGFRARLAEIAPFAIGA